MADHPAKLDYFGVEVVASFVSALIGDLAVLFTLPAILLFPIGLPIAAVGVGIHWFCGMIILGFLGPRLGLTGDLKEAALAATVGAGGEAALKGATKGAAKGLDISAPLRYGSSAALVFSVLWPLPAPSPFPLMSGVLIAILLHNKLIDFVVAQLGIVAIGVATGGAGFAAEGAAVGAEGGALAAEGAAAAASTGSAAAAGAAEAGGVAEGVAAAGRTGGAAGRAMGEAEKAAEGTAKELPRGALGEQETPFEEMERLFKELPQDEKPEEESEEVAEEEEKSENREGGSEDEIEPGGDEPNRTETEEDEVSPKTREQEHLSAANDNEPKEEDHANQSIAA